jgi:hypothetical protein
MHVFFARVFVPALLVCSAARAWTAPFSYLSARQRFHGSSSTELCGGVGIASNYSWKEEQFEIEVTITVPPETTAKDVKFKCSSNGIDLRLAGNDGNTEERILLDGRRITRGKICVEGTFWSISDADTSKSDTSEKQREISIIVEKHFVPTSSVGGTMTYDQLTDFDWGGIYPDDETEVTFREYEEAEELNVREYAAKLGVDIDNIDMSKVDKTMFGAGLRDDQSASDDDVGQNGPTAAQKVGMGFKFNTTQVTLDQLIKSGLAKEIVRQGDGTEYELGTFSDGGEQKPFSMFGKDVSLDELRDAGLSGERIPEMFQNSVPADEIPQYRQSDEPWGQQGDGIIEDEIVEQEFDRKNYEITDESINESISPILDTSGSEDVDYDDLDAKDPIDKLTVNKLKEILRNEGLKVSGNKAELRERLREHVKLLLEENS